MKELSIEEKAKRYDEAKARINKAYNDNRCTIGFMNEIFPELKESEDEKIRKALVEMVHDTTGDELWVDYNVHKEEALAWLEKQSSQILANSAKTGKDEQKPVYEDGPKFHKGQWIVWQDKCYKVNYNGCGYELVDQNGLSILLDYRTIDENAHIWDITKDAKDGDVLYSPTYRLIWIYKDKYQYHVAVNLSYVDPISFNGIIVIPSDICPATKEQWEQLEKAMADAGYTFDFEKKELKKIKKNDYEPDTLIEESYQQQADDLIDMVTEKPVWSKEDENQCINTIELVKNANDCAGILDKETALNWLKSLKEKVLPKNTWKPNDGQMMALEHFVRSIGESGYVPPCNNNTKLLLYSLLNDLKKLKA